MFPLVLILLSLSGVWAGCTCGVNYPSEPVCAVRGFSVSIPCSYYYPQTYNVTHIYWCSMNNNTDLCKNPPYVYNSSSNTTSDFEYVGDKKSNCTLLIHNVQDRYSGEYKVRVIMKENKFTGTPGVILKVADVKVSLIRLRGNGTLKQGDSLNLTCDVKCTHSSSQFVWSKNNEHLPESGPVLHFPALTVRDSGKYTCTWKTNQTSGSETISLHVEGLFSWYTGLGVKYPANPICAVRGFSVSVPCYYFYPPQNQVIQKLWCSVDTGTGYCINPPYVYDSSSNTTSDFEFVGDDNSDCTLLIHNVQDRYSGEYTFKFITNVTDGEYTGLPGATLQVTDVKVSLIRLRGNGTLKQGDSLNLTCDVKCTHSSSQFVWSKNNERLPGSGPVLHFPALTVRDSGKYTCTWKTSQTSGSETISLHMEGETGVIWIIAVVTAVGGFIILVLFGVVIHSWRGNDDAPDDRSKKVLEETQAGQVPQPNEEVLQQKEVVYASVCVKDNNLYNGPNEDTSVIYSTVAIK